MLIQASTVLHCYVCWTRFMWAAWEMQCSEGIGPNDDGETQQRAGAVVHGHMVSDHLQVHDVFLGAWQRLGEHQHGIYIAGTLQENMKGKYGYRFIKYLFWCNLQGCCSPAGGMALWMAMVDWYTSNQTLSRMGRDTIMLTIVLLVLIIYYVL